MISQSKPVTQKHCSAMYRNKRETREKVSFTEQILPILDMIFVEYFQQIMRTIKPYHKTMENSIEFKKKKSFNRNIHVKVKD